MLTTTSNQAAERDTGYKNLSKRSKGCATSHTTPTNSESHYIAKFFGPLKHSRLPQPRLHPGQQEYLDQCLMLSNPRAPSYSSIKGLMHTKDVFAYVSHQTRRVNGDQPRRHLQKTVVLVEHVGPGKSTLEQKRGSVYVLDKYVYNHGTSFSLDKQLC